MLTTVQDLRREQREHTTRPPPGHTNQHGLQHSSSDTRSLTIATTSTKHLAPEQNTATIPDLHPPQPPTSYPKPDDSTGRPQIPHHRPSLHKPLVAKPMKAMNIPSMHIKAALKTKPTPVLMHYHSTKTSEVYF